MKSKINCFRLTKNLVYRTLNAGIVYRTLNADTKKGLGLFPTLFFFTFILSFLRGYKHEKYDHIQDKGRLFESNALS